MKKSEAIKKRKRRMLIATLGISAVIIGGLTFAWYTSKDEVVNTFKASGDFKTTIVENFTPPTNWQPGTTTDKVVQVTNTGTVDAYTRVELVPSLTYYVADGNSVEASDYASGNTYVPASKAAIDSVAATDGYITVTSATDLAAEPALLPLSGKLTVPSNVTLYVKASEGQSKTSDNNVVESGYNYEFLGYLTDTVDGVEKTYAVEVVNGSGSNDYAYGSDPESNTGNVNHSISDELSIKIQPTKLVEYDYTTTEGQAAINNMVTLNFYQSDGSTATTADGSVWATREVTSGDMKTTYYYYKNVLKSGETTPRLLDSVKFNETFTDTVYDAQFDLNVVNISTQATYEAADGTYPTAESGVTGQESVLVDSGFSAATVGFAKSGMTD